MECLIMNYSDEEDVFPSEDGAESTHFTSRILNPDDAIQENIMEIADRPVNKNRTFGFPVVGSPCDLKGDVDNTNESRRNQTEDDENIEVVSDESNSKCVISSIITSNVETVVDDKNCLMLCKSNTSPISSTFIEDGANTETAMDFDNIKYHSESGYPISSKVDEESGRENEATDDLDFSKSHNVSLIKKEEGEESSKETPAAANFPISSSSLVGQEADLETPIDLVKGENYSIFAAKSERENEESDKENSTAATLPISFSSSGEQKANTATVIDLDNIKSHNMPLIKDEEDEESDKGNSTVATLPISSSSLLGQLAIAAAAIDFDGSKSHNIFLIEDKGHKQVDKGSSTAVPSPILSISLVRHEADMETVVVSHNSENHCVSPVSSDNEDKESNEENSAASTPNSTKFLAGHGADSKTAMDSNNSRKEHEISDKENLIAAILPISSRPLFGRGTAAEEAIDSDNSESRCEFLITGQQDEESNKEDSTAVRNPVNSTDELSDSQREGSRQFQANNGCCDTSANSQKYQGNPVIFDRRTFKCKLCPYNSTIRFGLKRHMLSHSEDLDLNKIKCELCPFKAKSKRSVFNHWLVTHKNEKSKCTICATFVPTYLKEKHLLKCKTKKNVFECKECQYKTLYARMFVRHQRECGNKRRSILHQSEASGDQCGNLVKTKQRGEINEPAKHLHRCEYCSYSTKRKLNLKTHIRGHNVFNRPIYSCSECDYKSTRHSLEFHMMMTHKIKFKDVSIPAETPHLKSCNFCSYTTKNGSHLTEHVSLHTVHNRPIYQCSKCDYRSTRTNLSKHVKTAHKIGAKNNSSLAKTRKVKKCDFCSYTTKYSKGMMNHRRLHIVKNSAIVSCTKCDYRAPRGTLAYHNLAVHGLLMNKKKEEKQVYTCTFCSFTTHNQSSFYRHTRLHTLRDTPIYHCPKCDYKSFKRNFLKHVKIAHQTESKNLSFLATIKKCDFCSFTTEIKQQLVRHRLLHTVKKNPIESCTRCDYKAPRITLFCHYKNVHRVHQSLVCTCKFCSYTTNYKSHLESHLLLHTVHNRPIYHCPKCDFKSTKFNLAKHMKTVHKIQSINTKSLKKTHTGKQAVALSRKNTLEATTEDLQKRTKRSNNKTNENEEEQTLERSQKVLVSNSKTRQQLVNPEYSCELCSFTTKFEANLNRHVWKHTVQNEQCNKSTHVNMTRHSHIQRREQRRSKQSNSKDLDTSGIKEEDTLKQSQKLASMIKIRKQVEQPYICDFCSFTTKFEQSLIRHRLLHAESNERIVSCSQCDYRSTKIALRQHSRIHRGGQTVVPERRSPRRAPPEDRQKTGSNSRMLSNGIDTKYNEGKEFVGQSEKHLSTTRTKGELSDLEYGCDLCSFTTNFEPNLDKHLNVHEVQNEQIASGSQCEFKSTKLQLPNSRIVYGEKLVSGQQKGETKVKNYHCQLCSFTTKMADAFERHGHLHEVNRTAVKSKKRKCEYWKKPAETANKRLSKNKLPEIHSSSDSFQVTLGDNNIVYVCEICDYTTNHKQNLMSHKLAHSSTTTLKAKSLSSVQANIPATSTSKASAKKDKDVKLKATF